MEQKTTILRLAKPKMKGIFGLLFSRLPLILLLIALQILMMVGLFSRFQEYIPHYAAFQSIFTVAMAFYLYNCSMDASAKLTWLLVIMLFPAPGAVFLAYTRTNLGHRLVKARTAELIDQTRGAIEQDESVMEALGSDNSG
ncbi:MAG: PLDc_N domain-containing protein, partial [Oscillospiraceae bacterium]|nr:PLDc_N domain-containing protein [Oscillospiraceae bacterium]